MYIFKGLLKNILKQNIITKDGNTFEVVTLQVESKSSNGRVYIEDIKVGKEKLSKLTDYKLGSIVELPVSVIVKNGYKNVYLQ